MCEKFEAAGFQQGRLRHHLDNLLGRSDLQLRIDLDDLSRRYLDVLDIGCTEAGSRNVEPVLPRCQVDEPV